MAFLGASETWWFGRPLGHFDFQLQLNISKRNIDMQWYPSAVLKSLRLKSGIWLPWAAHHPLWFPNQAHVQSTDTTPWPFHIEQNPGNSKRIMQSPHPHWSQSLPLDRSGSYLQIFTSWVANCSLTSSTSSEMSSCSWNVSSADSSHVSTSSRASW